MNKLVKKEILEACWTGVSAYLTTSGANMFGDAEIRAIDDKSFHVFARDAQNNPFWIQVQVKEIW